MNDLKEHIDDVQRKCSYYFKNTDLLLQAFTRKSYSAEFGGENNEVLEFLGDRVLDFYVTKVIAERYGLFKSQARTFNEEDRDEYLIRNYLNEQHFTDLKKELVNNAYLARRIEELDFKTMMYLGQSDLDNQVWNQEKVKADLFEAILGAIAIDSNWNPDELQNSVEIMLQIDDQLHDVEDGMDELKENLTQDNAVSTLKELAESGRCSIPIYEFPDEQVYVDGEYKWSCTCYVRSWSIQKTALSSSKKGAKKYATYLVLCDHFGIDSKEKM